MNEHANPIFRDILNGIAEQPAQLVRAANKASERRFDGGAITGFGPLEDQVVASIRRGGVPLESLRTILGVIATRLAAVGGLDTAVEYLDAAGDALDDVDADAPHERAELEADMAADLRERSR